MLFNSLYFLLFFPCVVVIYFIIPIKIKRLWLLGTSYFFYLCWNPKHIFLMIAITLLTWVTGLILETLKRKNLIHSIYYQKICISICCIGNLSILCFFKYFKFILDIINVILFKTGFRVLEDPFNFMLPVGISFYTFQAIGYVIDVYQEKIVPEKNLINYALFISFFPQLVAGPIERSENLLRQIRGISNYSQGRIDYNRITDGLFYILYGYFLKLVIADRISVLVDIVFERWYLYGSIELVVAAVGFAIQIYCDFSSYSIIAIGAAQVMGFELMENFKAPYLTENIKEFWKSWHISLSTWFRDYVYIPLGGNRCSKVRKNFNLMITFLVSGLWHGANWTYVVWGGGTWAISDIW